MGVQMKKNVISRSGQILSKFGHFISSSIWRPGWLSSANNVDREYINGETPANIGKLSDETDIPDKCDRYLKNSQRVKKRA